MIGASEIQVRKFECVNCKHADYRMSTREVGEVAPNECPKCRGSAKVTEERAPKWLAKPLGLAYKHFEVTDFVASSNRIELEVTARNSKKSFRTLLNALKPHGYLSVMRGRGEELKLLVVKTPPVKPGRVAINFLLIIATFMTTFAAGYFFLFDGHTFQAALFSAAIMIMLSAHELGHKIAAWRNGVDSTLPYFIPAPNILGTFGAVIKVKSPIPTKEALVEMGAAGPLIGFAVALPLTFIGLALSQPVPTTDPAAITLPLTPAIFGILQVGAFGHVPAALSINPLAFAGWVVMLLTLLNLMPAGQLDGGHVARGLLKREHHYTLTRTLGFSLFLTGMFFPGFPLWIWGFLIIIMFRGYHAGALDDVSKLSRHQKWLAIMALVVFLLCLPVPVG